MRYRRSSEEGIRLTMSRAVVGQPEMHGWMRERFVGKGLNNNLCHSDNGAIGWPHDRDRGNPERNSQS